MSSYKNKEPKRGSDLSMTVYVHQLILASFQARFLQMIVLFRLAFLSWVKVKDQIYSSTCRRSYSRKVSSCVFPRFAFQVKCHVNYLFANHGVVGHVY